MTIDTNQCQLIELYIINQWPINKEELCGIIDCHWFPRTINGLTGWEINFFSFLSQPISTYATFLHTNVNTLSLFNRIANEAARGWGSRHKRSQEFGQDQTRERSVSPRVCSLWESLTRKIKRRFSQFDLFRKSIAIDERILCGYRLIIDWPIPINWFYWQVSIDRLLFWSWISIKLILRNEELDTLFLPKVSFFHHSLLKECLT